MTSVLVPQAEAPTLAPPAAKRRRIRGMWRILPPVGVFAFFIGVWYLISLVILDPSRRFLLPSPTEVVDVGFLDPTNLTELLQGLARTSEVALIGLAIAMVLGVGGAVVMSQARWLELSLYPWAVLLQCIPILAARRRALDPAAQAHVSGQSAGDVRRFPDLGRSVGHRRHRR